jgi:hypothetical protein
MLRRAPDNDGRPRRRFGTDDLGGDPFARDAPEVTGPVGPSALGGWRAPASYLELDPQLVGELARASLSARGVAALRSGEVAVGAMLASLAIRGEDILLDELLPLDEVELRLHRYAVGQLTPIAVHPITSVAVLLRALAYCAASSPGETWEVVAHDGRTDPVAIAAARSHELRWLQPPAPDAPHSAPWAEPTTREDPPGSSVAWWQAELAKPAATAGVAPLLSAPINPDRVTAPIGRALGPEPAAAQPVVVPVIPERLPEHLLTAVGDTVDKALSNALIELELDPATLDELRDNSALERLADAVARLEQQVGQIDYVARQVQALTTAVDELTDSARSLMRHQWDNMPPQNYWVRMQRADEDVRRAVDELAAEVRGRMPRPGARPAPPRPRPRREDLADDGADDGEYAED